MQYLQICRNKVETEREVFLLCFVEKVNFFSNETPLGLQILIQNNLEVTLEIMKHLEILGKNCKILSVWISGYLVITKSWANFKKIETFFFSGKRRYNIKLWKTFTDCFNCLPIAAIIDEKIFCCHGGKCQSVKTYYV